MFLLNKTRKILLAVLFFSFIQISFAQDLVISPSPLYLGKIPLSSSSEREIIIFNTTVEQVTVNSLSITGPDADRFSIKDMPGSFTLGPIERKSLLVTYEPESAGENAAVLNIESSLGNYENSLTAYGAPLTGDVQPFERILGTSEDDGSGNIKQTDDGGFIIAGSTIPPGENYKSFYLTKTDIYGKVEWTSEYGNDRDDDSGSDVEQTGDGGYLVLGTTSSWGAGGTDIMLLKFNSSGEFQWRQTYGSENNDAGNAMVATQDGGFVLVGNTVPSSGIGKNIYLVKVDEEGNSQWETNYGGSDGTDASEIIELSDGSLVIAGFITVGDDFQVYLLKIDGSGNLVWEKDFGGADWDIGNSVSETNDGGFIVAGYTASKGAGARDGYLIKVNSDGEMVWDQTYGFERSDELHDVVESPDGGFVAVGNTITRVTQNEQFTSAFLIGADAEGNQLWSQIYGGDLNDGLGNVIIADDGGFVCAGNTSSYSKSNDIFLIKINEEGKVTGIENDYSSSELEKDFTLYQNYPNPFNPETTIRFTIGKVDRGNQNFVSLKVFDILGNEVRTLLNEHKSPGTYKVKFDGENLSSGVYIYQLSVNGIKNTKKMLMIK